jgi:hypothetical protein
MDIQLTASHWLYALVTLVVIGTMLFRRGVVVPTLIGTLLVGWVYNGSLIKGLQAVFNANLVAAKELFSIFLIITFMVALLHSLKEIGSDRLMVQPIQKFMTNGHIAFFVLIGITYVISLFFWPTPAVPLIGALLIPAAIRAGLPAMGAAMAVALAGQGMALSSDYVMQIAPMLSAKAAGVDTGLVADRALVLSFITGGVAILLAYLSLRKSVRKSGDKEIEKELAVLEGMNGQGQVKDEVAASSIDTPHRSSKLFAVLVPISLLLVVGYMILSKFNKDLGGFEGGDGAALIGGVAIVLLVLACFSKEGGHALDKIADHIVDGFVFAFKAMGPVIPIAGFFFLGSSDFSGSILGLGEEAVKPGFLFELVQSVQSVIPQSGLFAALGILIVGIITGLDGSGFSGLPLTGGLAGAISGSVGVDPSTLAAIGQMGAIWTGGGTIIAWSSLVAVAGFAGVSVIDLARKNFIPVITGLVVATIFAVVIW